MKEHVNFYENIKEATMRLCNTIVLYDDDPFYVLTICDHKDDGIFRVYLDPIPDNPTKGMAQHTFHIPYNWHDEPGMNRGQKMDQWLETPDGKKSGVMRKMMNSPKFNKFRPFPLGMQNIYGSAVYLERKPCRYTQQGLMDNMFTARAITLSKGDRPHSRSNCNYFGYEMYQTIKGIYPSAEECVENFKADKIANEAVAFHRDFAFVNGPLGILYLAHKAEVVGFLPTADLSEVRIGRENRHLIETVQELNIFHKVS